MKRALTPAALVLAGAASICAAPVIAAPVRDEGESHLLRLRLRPGDEWRERVLHEVEVLDGSGRVAWTHRCERVEMVRVLSLLTGLDAVGGGSARRIAPEQRRLAVRQQTGALTRPARRIAPDQRRAITRPARRWARVRRTPEPATEDSPPPAPYEVLVSSLGELALPPPGETQPADDAARVALFAGLVSRFAPVLPERGLAVGGKASRVMGLRFASGARWGPAFAETETATLVSVGAAEGDGTPRGDVALLTISRRAGPQMVSLADAALAAPGPGSLVAVASPEELDIEVLGASGDGELRFNPVRGVLLSYSMRETLGVAARLGNSSVRRTVNVRFEIERLEQP